jgi:ABC-type branched-subunit amino acid transport system substrate-binding protein
MLSRVTSIALVAAALLLASCGGNPTHQPAQREATVVIAAPTSGVQGAFGRDLIEAARLELKSQSCSRGPVKIRLKSVNVAAGEGALGDPERVASLARAAVEDSDAVAWIAAGDSNSTAISLPLLNEAGISVVSPTATAVSFTTADPAFPGAPTKYYPALETYGQAFARLVADDSAIARAALRSLRKRGIKSVYLADAGDTDGQSFGSLMTQLAPSVGIKVAGTDSVDASAVDWPGFVDQIRASGAQAVVWGSPAGDGGEELWKAVERSKAPFAMVGGPALGKAALTKLPKVPGGSTMFTSVTSAGDAPVATAALDEAFRKAHGHLPADGSLGAATAIGMLCLAIDSGARTAGPREAGSGLRAATTKSLKGILSFRSPSGSIIRMNRSGGRVGGAIVEVSSNGSAQPIGDTG